jgi:hypothetical protein
MSSLKIKNSSETYALLHDSLFMSAFNGFIVFGLLTNDEYKEGQFFKFNFHDVYKLYVNILYISSYLASDLDSSQGIIDQFDSSVYFWKGITVTKNNEVRKAIKFGIETNSNVTFDICLSAEEYNNFLLRLQRCLLACICLKDDKEEFISAILQESTETIVEAKLKYQSAKTLTQNYFNKNPKFQFEKKAGYIEILSYYNDLILILKQLSGLYTPETSHRDLILAI